MPRVMTSSGPERGRARGRPLTTALALGVGIGTLAACDVIIDEPVVDVVDVRAASIGLTGGTLLVTLEVTNRNRYGLNSDGFTYRLDLAEQPGSEEPMWQSLVDGAHEGPVVLPGRGSTRVAVDVPFSYGDVGGVVGRLLKRGELEYRFSGAFQFSLPIGGIAVPFDERGTFRP